MSTINELRKRVQRERLANQKQLLITGNNIITRTYKTELRLSAIQKRGVDRWIAGCRFLYNLALDQRNIYKAMDSSYRIPLGGDAIGDKVSLTYVSNYQAKEITKLKQEIDWLRDINSNVIRNTLVNLDRSFENFFRRCKDPSIKEKGYPKFKNRDSDTGIKFNGDITVSAQGIYVHTLGKKVQWKVFEKGYIPEGEYHIEYGSISRKAGRYFIALCRKEQYDIPVVKKRSEVLGIDLGIKSIAVFSNGMIFDNPRHLQQSEKRLTRAQRKLARQQKGSNRRNKQKQRIAKIHVRISNQRQHTQHGISATAIALHPKAIRMETLGIQNMMKNRKLSKAIASVGWGELTRQIEYKAGWNKIDFQKANRWYASSQICSVCAYINKDVKDLKIRDWICPQCNTNHNRDVNAAKNLATL